MRDCYLGWRFGTKLLGGCGSSVMLCLLRIGGAIDDGMRDVLAMKPTRSNASEQKWGKGCGLMSERDDVPVLVKAIENGLTVEVWSARLTGALPRLDIF